MSDEAIREIVKSATREAVAEALAARDARRQSFYAGLKRHVIAPAIAFLDRWHGVEKEGNGK